MTTKLGKFKLGPAKTREGWDAEIFKIVPEQRCPLLGALRDKDKWRLVVWDLDGKPYGDAEDGRIVPNNEPERVGFVFEFPANIPAEPPLSWSQLFFQARYSLPGKRCKVTVEVLDG